MPTFVEPEINLINETWVVGNTDFPTAFFPSSDEPSFTNTKFAFVVQSFEIDSPPRNGGFPFRKQIPANDSRIEFGEETGSVTGSPIPQFVRTRLDMIFNHVTIQG